MNGKHPFIETLRTREHRRDDYWHRRDPIADDRSLWRAQTFRQLVHLLPGQTILEVGCGQGRLTRQLLRMTRGENPITALSFDSAAARPDVDSKMVEFVTADEFPASLKGRRFDFVVGMDLLDHGNCAWLMQNIYELLNDGGQVVLYESNPWNPVLKLRQVLGRLLRQRDDRRLLSRPELYELLSEVGFLRTFAVYSDFVYAPLAPSRTLAWFFRNLSVLLENAPLVRTLAGGILLHAQRPPRQPVRPRVSLFRRERLRGAVSVVIPCRNEEMNVGPLVRGLKDHFGEYLHEIIPVDDSSTDNTRAVLQEMAAQDPIVRPVFRSPPNGVGRALLDGYRAATGKYVLSMDCDFQHLLPEVRDLFDAAAEGYDVVVGSRFSRHSVLLNYPFQKIVANRGFHLLAQLVLVRRFRDLTNNLKLMRREVIEKMQLLQPGFAVNAETGLLPLLMGCSMKEVPISWINRTPDMGISSFKLATVGGGYWRVLYQLWLKRHFNAGPYRTLPVMGKWTMTWRDAGVPAAEPSDEAALLAP